MGKSDETKVRKSDSRQADSPESDVMATSGSTRRTWSVVVYCISTRLFFSWASKEGGKEKELQPRSSSPITFWCDTASGNEAIWAPSQASPEAVDTQGNIVGLGLPDLQRFEIHLALGTALSETQ